VSPAQLSSAVVQLLGQPSHLAAAVVIGVPQLSGDLFERRPSRSCFAGELPKQNVHHTCLEWHVGSQFFDAMVAKLVFDKRVHSRHHLLRRLVRIEEPGKTGHLPVGRVEPVLEAQEEAPDASRMTQSVAVVAQPESDRVGVGVGDRVSTVQ
jgi:hypothetical protein